MNLMIDWLRSNVRLLIGALMVLALTGLLAFVDGYGNWVRGWLAYSLLIGLGLLALLLVNRYVRGDGNGLNIAFDAFLIRLAAGILLALLLPVAGYQDNPVTQAGYVFKDAFVRDKQAWSLANSGQPIIGAFEQKYSGDQYGGMLALSAAVYRFLSPDEHRKILILAITAAVSAWGALFFWKACHNWFGEPVAGTATWIFALYPESVLLGSSQMREPFVIAAIALGFYGLTELPKSRLSGLFWMAISTLILFFFQPPIGLFALAALFVAWLLEPNKNISWKQVGIFAGILLVGVLVVFSLWSNLPSLHNASPVTIFSTWLEKNFNFQSYLTKQASRDFRVILRSAGSDLKLLVVLAYGFAQPVLPAAIVDPTGAWIWRIINILRALGWYMLAPLLLYGLFRVIRVPVKERRFQLLWIALVAWAWILISAAAAGGDMWDNPRYRTIFLAWEALLAAWAWYWASAREDAWLRRLMVLEVGLVLLFIVWYVSRYTPNMAPLDIRLVVSLAILLVLVVLVSGWLWNRRRNTP